MQRYEWAIELRQDVQKKLIKIAEKLAHYHVQKNEVLKAVEYLEQVMEFECIEIDFYEKLKQLYVQLDDLDRLDRLEEMFF